MMAAAYLFHINKNHPFIDGNKRTATAAALVFLELNGIDFIVTDERLIEMALAVASGTADKRMAAEFFRKHWPSEDLGR